MASISHAQVGPRAQAVRVKPQSVTLEQTRRRRHRFLKAIILLTIPFYCVGLSMLTLLRIEVILNRVASSPLFLGGLLFLALLLLIEPWTGAVTHSCIAGAKCASMGVADPVSCLTLIGGCLTVIGVMAGIVAFVVWLV